jgi:hypothetical protein
MTRAVLGRGIRVFALAAYVAIVTLAAWRHEIRPAFMDPPAALARNALALLGVPPGVAVFTAEVDTSPDSKIASLCLEARAVDAEGLARRIYPEEGRRCPAPAPRLWIRGEDIALSRFPVIMRSAVAARRAGILPATRLRFPQLLAESLAEHIQSRARDDGLTPTRYAVLWTESRVGYGSGARSDRIVALLRWRADSVDGGDGGDGHGRVFVSWSPSERTLQQHWPALGAR